MEIKESNFVTQFDELEDVKSKINEIKSISLSFSDFILYIQEMKLNLESNFNQVQYYSIKQDKPLSPTGSFENLSAIEKNSKQKTNIINLTSNFFQYNYKYEELNEYLQSNHNNFKKILENRNLILKNKFKNFYNKNLLNKENLTKNNRNDILDFYPQLNNLLITNSLIPNSLQKSLKSFFITKKSLQYLDQHLNKKNPIESFHKINNNLKITENELLNEYNRLNSTFNIYDEYLTNPPFDIIREYPLYQELLKGSEVLEPELINLYNEFENNLNNIFLQHSKLYKILSEIDFLPTNQLNEIEKLINEDSNTNFEQRKLLFMRLVSSHFPIKQLNCESVINYLIRDSDTFSCALSTLESNDHEGFQQILLEFKSEIPKFKENIKDSNEKIKNYENLQNEALQKWMREPTKRIDPQTLRSLNSTRDRVKNYDQYIRETEKQLIDKLNNLKKNYNNFSTKTFNNINLNISKLIENNSTILSTKNWLIQRKKLINLKIEEKKNLINEKKKLLENIKIEIENKKKIIPTFNKNKINKTQNSQILEKLKQRIQCDICQDNKRNTIILACGHTFCKTCADGLTSSRNRNCPRCQTRFTQYDIKQFSK